MRTIELQLPLGDTGGGGLAVRRLEHLRQLEGVDDEVVQRLARSFPSLRAIYSAGDEELAQVVGPVTAARIRWFLDAPLDTALAVTPTVTPLRSLRQAA
jgi:ERCC4-type nuclease